MEQPMEDCLLWEGPTAGAAHGAAHGGLSPVGRTHCWSRAEGEESSPEEDGAAETAWDELTAAPTACPPELLVGRRWRKSRVTFCLGRREGWGKGVLGFGSISHYPALFGNK